MDSHDAPANAPGTPPGVDATEPSPPRFQRLRVIAFIAIMTAMGAAAWNGLPRAASWVKGWLARRHVPEMREAVGNRDWNAAMTAMHAARRWASDDPEVLHACVEFISEAGGDPRTVISLIRQLQEAKAATPEDLALMGRMHILVDESAKARLILAQIPPELRQSPEVLRLQAMLLKSDGKDAEAQEMAREALILEGDSPQSLIKLARFDLFDSQPDRRAHIRERLWQLARSDDDRALDAVAVLATTPDLSSPEASELEQIVEASADDSEKKTECRLRVLSARMRISPHLRNDIIEAEIKGWSGSTPGQITPLAAWLAEEGQHDRLLQIIPVQTAAAYPDLLPHYIAALRAGGKWLEMDQILRSRKLDPAIPAQKLRLWSAEVQARLHKDMQGARQTLARVFEEAGRGKKAAETLETATLAEEFHFHDLALRCYRALAEQQPQMRDQFLPKAYRMAEFEHDGMTMLAICDDLLAIKPDNTAILIQKLYLHVLLGTEIEAVQHRLDSLDHVGSDLRTDQFHLLQALAAFRQGMPDSVGDSVRRISRPENLPPGQRAVFASLLKHTGGDAALAFRLVERISPILLLPEEKAFFLRAK